MKKVRVKICCIGSLNEAETAIRFGADALGLVGHMPSGPGEIPDSLIRKISRAVPPSVSTFLLTSETSADNIIGHYRNTFTSAIQLVDELNALNIYTQLRNELPMVKIVQVVHVTGESAVKKAIDLSKYADTLLLDSGNPDLNIKELGGTGRVHDWMISREIVTRVKIPVFLAGGLNAGNIRKAIETVKPFGVDVCSGVRTDGKLDPVKLKAFFEAIEK